MANDSAGEVNSSLTPLRAQSFFFFFYLQMMDLEEGITMTEAEADDERDNLA